MSRYFARMAQRTGLSVVGSEKLPSAVAPANPNLRSGEKERLSGEAHREPQLEVHQELSVPPVDTHQSVTTTGNISAPGGVETNIKLSSATSSLNTASPHATFQNSANNHYSPENISEPNLAGSNLTQQREDRNSRFPQPIDRSASHFQELDMFAEFGNPEPGHPESEKRASEHSESKALTDSRLTSVAEPKVNQSEWQQTLPERKTAGGPEGDLKNLLPENRGRSSDSSSGRSAHLKTEPVSSSAYFPDENRLAIGDSAQNTSFHTEQSSSTLSLILDSVASGKAPPRAATQTNYFSEKNQLRQADRNGPGHSITARDNLQARENRVEIKIGKIDISVHQQKMAKALTPLKKAPVVRSSNTHDSGSNLNRYYLRF